jgi:hypothetical protein
MVEMRVAARHSGTLGAAREEDLQEICHLSSVTAEARKLKKPSWAWQEEQKAFKCRVWVAVLTKARLCLSAAP